MRRRLLPLLPALTRFYGLRPWEWEELSGFEVEEYVAQWREHVRRMVAEANGEEVTGGPVR